MPYSKNKIEICGWLAEEPKVTEHSVLVKIATERWMRSPNGQGQRIVEVIPVYISLGNAKNCKFDVNLRTKLGEKVYVAGRQIEAIGRTAPKKDGTGTIVVCDAVRSVMISYPEKKQNGAGASKPGLEAAPVGNGGGDNDIPY